MSFETRNSHFHVYRYLTIPQIFLNFRLLSVVEPSVRNQSKLFLLTELRKSATLHVS